VFNSFCCCFEIHTLHYLSVPFGNVIIVIVLPGRPTWRVLRIVVNNNVPRPLPPAYAGRPMFFALSTKNCFANIVASWDHLFDDAARMRNINNRWPSPVAGFPDNNNNNARVRGACIVRRRRVPFDGPKNWISLVRLVRTRDFSFKTRPRRCRAQLWMVSPVFSDCVRPTSVHYKCVSRVTYGNKHNQLCSGCIKQYLIRLKIYATVPWTMLIVITMSALF